jgi:cytochrome c6
MTKSNKLIHVILFTIISLCYFSSASAANNGRSLYNNHCSRCHGTDGSGGFMPGIPNFTYGNGLQKNTKQLLERIQNGENACPSYRGIISEKETLSLINHLRTFY